MFTSFVREHPVPASTRNGSVQCREGASQKPGWKPEARADSARLGEGARLQLKRISPANDDRIVLRAVSETPRGRRWHVRRLTSAASPLLERLLLVLVVLLPLRGEDGLP